ncbi:SPOR domain-containing protein [Nitrincola sp.]|uniref:SPOR domain-containing protein n=1 Tax=Nitrincola sp. TaxID=1926584 RepID=UPI003A90F1D2
MARQDYAQKRRRGTSASRSAPKRQPTKPPVRRKPWWPRALLAAAALIGLIYLLKTLIASGPQGPTSTDTQPVRQPAPTRPAEPVQVTPVLPTEPAVVVPSVETPEMPPPPEAPEARFDFYDILPRSEVQGPQNVYHSTPRDAPEAQSRHLLQAGSFRAEADAERMRAELLLSGLPNVHTSRVEGDNGIWYRVRTGPFNNRTELNRARNQLTSLGITPLPIPLD